MPQKLFKLTTKFKDKRQPQILRHVVVVVVVVVSVGVALAAAIINVMIIK